MDVTAFSLAQRWIGTAELVGPKDNPFVLGMLRLDTSTVHTDVIVAHDETPWCSAFVNFIAWQLRLPRSKSLAARSWLRVGTAIRLAEAQAAFDVVVLMRGEPGPQPGPDVLAAPGHVGFFAGCSTGMVDVLAGNQGNAVSIASFPAARVLGVRRLA